MGDIEYNAAEAARYGELHPDATFVLAADYAALEAQVQQFRDAYTNDREIMAENVAQISAHEARIEALETTLDALRQRQAEVLVQCPKDSTCCAGMCRLSRIRAIIDDTGAPEGPLA